MAVERASGGSSLIEVLDRILDKGIVLDAWVRISLTGIDLTAEDRIVVAASDTCFDYAQMPELDGAPAKPARGAWAPRAGCGEGASRPARNRR